MTNRTKVIQKPKGRKPKYDVGVKQSQSVAEYKKGLRNAKIEEKKAKIAIINDKAGHPELDFTLRFV